MSLTSKWLKATLTSITSLTPILLITVNYHFSTKIKHYV